jgi:hypothetical protein
MTDACAWFITLGENNAFAQTAARTLATYGLPVKGQRWPLTDESAWVASAQEAAQANAAVLVITGTHEQFNQPHVRRSLSLFRLSLQTRRQRPVNGIVLLSDAGSGAPVAPPSPHAGVLDDWTIAGAQNWQAKAVARAHAPIASRLPVRLGLHAHDRLGIWLEVHPCPDQTAAGALVGVSGNNATISFHAVGPSGGLPERTVNEYELQGVTFDAAGASFHAWALQNSIPVQNSYFIRLEGEPDLLAIGTLPEGRIEDVHLIRMA